MRVQSVIYVIWLLAAKFSVFDDKKRAKTSEYDQEMQQSQIADQPMTPWGRDIRVQTNKAKN